jgi:hypothetical protein
MLQVFRVRVSAVPRAYYVLARTLQQAIEKATARARKDGAQEVDVASVRRLGKAVR